MADRILLENQKPGTPQSVWDAPASNQIEGFATQFSVDNGSTVSFKVNLNVAQGATAPYNIEIYRLGYYGGDGATLVTTINGLSGTAQPNPVTDSRGVVDAGNWSVSASWTTPADAVSGVYLAKLVRTDNGATNQIPFVVRDDGATSDILLQTSDTTWQAYNGWGGRNGQVGPSLYGGFDQPANIAPDQNPSGQDRAFAVSYNRPFITRDGGGTFAGPQDYLFGADYSAIHWLEKNGYDVSYVSGVDTDRLGANYLTHYKAFISVGHDEYWSGAQRANVEAARDAGVNLLFWSGNEVYWKTRWEDSIADGAPFRTLVSYKETKFNYSLTAGPQDYPNVDPSNQWTGTWRDLRFVDAVGPDGVTHTAVGAKPENALTGQLFGPDGTGEFGGALDIPAAYAGLRVWRDTGVGPGGALNIAPGIIGYEWDASPEDAYRPAGLVKLSETTLSWSQILTDQGNRTAPGVETHSLSLYRAPSGALVFGAGTVFWSWGLSNQHDASPYAANIASNTLQQFTVNMFADMGIQPRVADAILQSQGLVRALASNDHIAATTTLNNLPDSVTAQSQVTISGTASDIDNNPSNDDGRVALVEVSLDGGATWKVAQGAANWTYSWTPTAQGSYTIKARAVDDSLNILPNSQLATDVVTVTAPSQPSTFSLFGPSVTPTGQMSNDGQAVELGVKFRATEDGVVTQLRYFRATGDAGDTDVREGHLWSANGTLLGTVTFNSGPGQSGWQVATLATPVTIQAGATYVASYKTANNYMADDNYFTTTFNEPFGVLSAPASSQVGGNGVYAYGSALQFPTQTFAAANYWADVVFDPADANGPPAAPSAPDLVAASDTGASATDNLTNDNTPTLAGTAVAASTIELKDGATLVGSATADAGGAWSITTSSLADGSHVFTATATTANGTSAASAGLAVTIDTTPPSASTPPDMTAASDDGASNTDNTTSVTTPTFVGTVANESTAVVTLFDAAVQIGSATVDSAGTWSITSTALSPGSHSITARATDAAGNVGAPSSPLPVSIVSGGGPSQVSLFGPSVTPPSQVQNDGQAVELGVKFRATEAGVVTQLRYFRTTGDAGDTDVREGHLWSSNGTLLGTATFNSGPGQSGWQVASLATPVTIQAGTTYVASYKTADNYVASTNYFTTTFSEPSGVLSAPASSEVGGNGVYAYGSAVQFPTQSFSASNYWVDVVFGPSSGTPSPQIGFSTTALTLAEGNSGTSAFAYTVTRTGDTSGVSSASWTVVGAGANPANATDFQGGVLPSGTVSFAAGESSKTVTVNVAGDTTVEPDEGFTVTLSGPSGATLGAATAAGTITDDDASNTGVVLKGTSGDNTLSGGGGDDSISGLGGADRLSGNAGRDTLDGGSGNDTVDAGAGDDLLLIRAAEAQFDSLVGGDGTDTLRVNPAGGAVTLAGTGAISTIEVFDGGGQAVRGNGSANLLDFSGFASVVGVTSISGQGGSDTLTGTSGADILDGGGGADQLNGGAGDDVFLFRAAEGQSDTVVGGAGTDTLRVDPAGGAVTLAGVGTISMIEVFDGSGQAVQGNGSANLLDFSGFASVVGVTSISGQGGNDTLTGTSGADVLIGGAGADRLTGGAGDDVFRYLALNESTSSARDVIQDFTGAGVAGGDVIDASALVPGTFVFNGTGAFSGGGVASIRYAVSGGVTDVLFDNGNGGAAEMIVRINAVTTLYAGDFIL